MEEEWDMGFFSDNKYHSAKVEADASKWVYDTVSHFKDRSLKGITNVGYKPTVGENFLGVETYLFDCDEDLYGQSNVEWNFYNYSRPEKRFSSIEALKEQLMKDAEKARLIFKASKSKNFR